MSCDMNMVSEDFIVDIAIGDLVQSHLPDDGFIEMDLDVQMGVAAPRTQAPRQVILHLIFTVEAFCDKIVNSKMEAGENLSRHIIVGGKVCIRDEEDAISKTIQFRIEDEFPELSFGQWTIVKARGLATVAL